jgi:hypothetical protein
MNHQDLHLLNQANVVLIPKKNDPLKVSDYRLISLVHSFAKNLSKLLTNRLAPELNHLISINQTAFIKKRCIHDNFMYVQQVVKDLYKKRIPSIFIKLDISKAFDSVNWPYLLTIMQHLGFGQRWRNWISSLWCTASSCYLVNGEPSARILHCRGVRQGDPLSPMIFLLAMEPLHRLFKKAQDNGLLDIVTKSCESFRVSLYADDAAVFIKPSRHDLQVVNCILQIFHQASGLATNMDKTQFFPIIATILTSPSSLPITCPSPTFLVYILVCLCISRSYQSPITRLWFRKWLTECLDGRRIYSHIQEGKCLSRQC